MRLYERQIIMIRAVFGEQIPQWQVALVESVPVTTYSFEFRVMRYFNTENDAIFAANIAVYYRIIKNRLIIPQNLRYY